MFTVIKPSIMLSDNYLNAKKLYQSDEFKKSLDILDSNKSNLDADGLYLKAEIYLQAEKGIHGISRNTKRGISLLKQAVKLGSVEAQHELGTRYYLGDGVPENLEKSIELLGVAANYGDELAQFELANILYDNDSNASAIKALGLYELLVNDEQFGAGSLLKIGRMYCRGKANLDVDYKTGAKYLERSAALGNSNAMMDLAYMYYKGQYFERDLEKAILYAQKAGPDHLLYEDIMEELTGLKD